MRMTYVAFVCFAPFGMELHIYEMGSNTRQLIVDRTSHKRDRTGR
jgi:hypothetical protein